MKFLGKIAIYTLLFIAIARILPQYFFIDSIVTALIASFVLVLLNYTVKPILRLISFPITILTFGLFSIVINAVMLELTSNLLSGMFHFSSFGGAMLVAILMSISNTIINNYVRTR